MPLTCSETLRAAPEPNAGTAPQALGWLAIEVDGSWGRKALTSSALDAEVGARIAERVATGGVKVVLIRRPGRHAAGRDPRRTVLLAHAGTEPWLERLHVTRDTELLDLDPAVCARPEPPGIGERVADPQFLVCTHARRDRCCATLGRPIVDTLAALHPDLAWEVSHLGGHRFAGNLLVLPHGLVYGSLDVASALSAVASHLTGSLDLEHLRGRSALTRAAQTAEIALRRAHGLDRLGGVEVVDVTTRGDASVVTLDTAVTRAAVEVRREPIGARLLSCDADEPEDPHTFRVTRIRALAGRRDGGPPPTAP